MANLMQDILAKQAAAAGRRVAGALGNMARVSLPSGGGGLTGVFPGEVTESLGPDGYGIQRYTVVLAAGWTKTGALTVPYAQVADDDADLLAVGAKVSVALHPGAPALIISGGGGLTIGDLGNPIWYFGYLNNSGT